MCKRLAKYVLMSVGLSIATITSIAYSQSNWSMNQEISTVCIESISRFEKKFLSKNGKKKYTPQERINYLNEITTECQDINVAIVYKSQALMEAGNFDDGLSEIDRGIKLGLRPIGNLLNVKANSLRVLKQSGVDIPETYSDIIELYKLALSQENNIESSIHIGWAEAAVMDKRWDEAMQHLEISADIDPTSSRIFSLGAVVLAHKGQYEGAIELIEIAVQKNPDNYFYEADSILAIATALCKTGRNKEATAIVAKAQRIGKKYRHLPEMVEAAKVVLNCPE